MCNINGLENLTRTFSWRQDESAHVFVIYSVLHLYCFIFIVYCEQVFEGNRNRNAVVKRYLAERLVAKRLRILRYQNSDDFMGSTVCLRAEIYGCYMEAGEWRVLLTLQYLSSTAKSII